MVDFRKEGNQVHFKRKVALITGCGGQDGSYLVEFLLDKGYEVHGLVREVTGKSFADKYPRLSSVKDKIDLHYGEIKDCSIIQGLLEKVQPDEVYHLAAQSSVKDSFQDPTTTFQTNIDGTINILSSLSKVKKDSKFYFAGTSEMFGLATEFPQNEKTPFNPVSPYAISKVAGFYLTRFYRDAYNMFACSGILFNHESPRREYEFVTRKITHSAALIKNGRLKELQLGNLGARRDWGYAGDYIRAMWLMLQQKNPKDYVIGTGVSHSIQDWAEEAFSYLGLDWQKYVKVNESFLRPVDIKETCADASLAKAELGWEPKVGFKELVVMMLEADCREVEKDSNSRDQHAR